MPSINLSQPANEKSTQAVDKGTGRKIVIGIFLTVLVVWALVQAGMILLDQKMLASQQRIDDQKMLLTGEGVNAIADIDARLQLVKKNMDRQVTPQVVLAALEKLVLPANRLTSFEHDPSTGAVSLEVVAPNYKEVAQQLLAFKASGEFSGVKISDLTRDKELQNIAFSIDMQWNIQPK